MENDKNRQETAAALNDDVLDKVVGGGSPSEEPVGNPAYGCWKCEKCGGWFSGYTRDKPEWCVYCGRGAKLVKKF